MKLVFVNRFYWPDESATSQLLTDLCVHLARRGYEVHVVASRSRHEDPKARLAVYERASGVHVHRVPTTRFGRMNLPGRAIDYLTFYASAWWRLTVLVHRGDVVIAETDPPLVSVVAAAVCRNRGAALVNWVQDVFPEVAHRLGFRSPGVGSLLAAMRDRSLEAATVNVALSDGMAAHLRARAPTARTLVLHNWSDGKSVRPVPRATNRLRLAWGLSDRFVVGYSGNLGRAHDFETILGACERLQQRDDIAFLFVGGGPQYARLQAQAARRHLRNVNFQPFQPRERLASSLAVPDVHIVSLWPALDGLIVPSKFYGIAAAGRAMIFIGRRGGDLASLVESHGLGLTVASGDAEALAKGIADLSSDRGAASRMGERARSLFEQRFDISIALAQWESILQSVMHRPE